MVNSEIVHNPFLNVIFSFKARRPLPKTKFMPAKLRAVFVSAESGLLAVLVSAESGLLAVLVSTESDSEQC